MSANKNFDKHNITNITINIGNVYVQNNVSATNDLLKNGSATEKSSFYNVLARIGGFFKRLATKILCFIRNLLLLLN